MEANQEVEDRQNDVKDKMELEKTPVHDACPQKELLEDSSSDVSLLTETQNDCEYSNNEGTKENATPDYIKTVESHKIKSFNVKKANEAKTEKEKQTRKKEGLPCSQRVQCSECGVKLANKYVLKLHLIAKHNVGSKKQCDQCEYQAATQIALGRHIDTHHKNIRYQCGKCDYKATQESSLKVHVRNTHDGVKFTCEACGKLFALRATLQLHIVYKHGERKFKCDHCEYNAGQAHHLKSHKLSQHSVLSK
jgi:hypothetical protein